MVLALIDLVNKKQGTYTELGGGQLKISEQPPQVMEVTLMVVGAGRGPLVRASLVANREVSELLKVASNDTVRVNLTVFAVEKVSNL